MDYSGKEIFLALIGSGGFVGGIITLLSYVAGRIDARRARQDQKKKLELSESADMRKYDLDERNIVHKELWEIIECLKEDKEKLEKELASTSLTRPTVTKVYRNLRAMRAELESLNVMVLDEQQTNVFMRRFQTVKQLLDETESMLP